MIYTLTMNPAIDMNICSKGLVPKRVNRTFNASYSANGKGLNVSFALGCFGIPSGILGFFGGFSGKFIVEEARSMGYQVCPVWVEDTTRINVFLNDGSSEYVLANEGSFVPEEARAELLKVIREIDDMDYLCISGSLPKGISPDYYEDILKVCKEKGVEVILDISSPKLSELLAYQPILIKPNDEELEQIFGYTLDSEEAVVMALKELHGKGARNILLTLGERGSYFYNGRHICKAGIRKVEVLNSACAGDVALGGFLSVWLNDKDAVEYAMRNAAAAGANAAESQGIGTLAKVPEYREEIGVRRIWD